MDAEKQNQCVLELYDAAIRPKRWRHALDLIAECSGGSASMALVRRPSGWRRDLQLLSSRYLDFSRSAAGLYYGLRYSHLQNPDWNFLSNFEPLRPVWDLESGYSVVELDHRGDYAFLKSKIGVSRRLGTRLNADKVWFDGLSVGFPASNVTISDTPKTKLAPVLPHFAKAIEMSRLFLELRRRHRAVLSALDHVDVPLLVVDSKRSVIVANQRAHHAIQEIPALYIGADDRLTSDNADLLARLQSHIEETCSLRSNAPLIGKDLVNLEPDGDDALLQLAIAPIRDADHDLDGDEGLAMLTIISPRFLPRSDLGIFVRQHQLTAAEAEVCQLIYEGLNVSQIADRRETTAATAKNQTASVLSKTNTRNRIELIRTIINTNPPIL